MFYSCSLGNLTGHLLSKDMYHVSLNVSDIIQLMIIILWLPSATLQCDLTLNKKKVCVFTVSPQNMFATTLSCWWPNVEAIPVPVIIFSYLICNNVVNQQQLCSAPCSCVKAINDWLLKISVICSNVLYFFAKGEEVQTSERRSWKSDECGKCLFLAAYVFLGVGLHQVTCKILQVGKQIRSLEAVE